MAWLHPDYRDVSGILDISIPDHRVICKIYIYIGWDLAKVFKWYIKN